MIIDPELFFIQELADNGSAKCQWLMMHYYSRGIGVPKDLKQMLKYCKLLVEQPEEKTCFDPNFNYGEMFMLIGKVSLNLGLTYQAEHFTVLAQEYFLENYPFDKAVDYILKNRIPDRFLAIEKRKHYH